MKAGSGTSAPWVNADLWLTARKAPFVVVLAGIDSSGIVEPALADTAIMEAALLRFEPGCAPPCDALLWRLETAFGEALNHPGLLGRQWHRPPYAITLRLVQYQPGSVLPEILDEGTLGTRGPYAAFKAATDRLAMRFLRDAALGRARGPSDAAPAAAAHGLPGWMDVARAKWRDRMRETQCSIGTVPASTQHVLSGQGLGIITLYRGNPDSGDLANPFPLVSSRRVPCGAGVGPIGGVKDDSAALAPMLLDDGHYSAYPSTLLDGDTAYCVPHAPVRGATRIYCRNEYGELVPVCDPAPHLRLASPALFRWNSRYWLACTDLDMGEHDNLCLLHAPAIAGPWTPHARWPVKIDVRGARPAGMLFSNSGRLFRPGQDRACGRGPAVVVHEVYTLTATDFHETRVTVLRPDRAGPSLDGCQTPTDDGDRSWLDGKGLLPELGGILRKARASARRLFARAGMST